MLAARFPATEASFAAGWLAMPKTDAAKLPIITFKPFISERDFELLANAVVEQAVHDYKRLLHRVYVKGEHNPKAWYVERRLYLQGVRRV